MALQYVLPFGAASACRSPPRFQAQGSSGAQIGVLLRPRCCLVIGPPSPQGSVLPRPPHVIATARIAAAAHGAAGLVEGFAPRSSGLSRSDGGRGHDP
jgi:hypothetical protein